MQLLGETDCPELNRNQDVLLRADQSISSNFDSQTAANSDPFAPKLEKRLNGPVFSCPVRGFFTFLVALSCLTQDAWSFPVPCLASRLTLPSFTWDASTVCHCKPTLGIERIRLARWPNQASALRLSQTQGLPYPLVRVRFKGVCSL